MTSSKSFLKIRLRAVTTGAFLPTEDKEVIQADKSQRARIVVTSEKRKLISAFSKVVANGPFPFTMISNLAVRDLLYELNVVQPEFEQFQVGNLFSMITERIWIHAGQKN
jgi:hypothetical protein